MTAEDNSIPAEENAAPVEEAPFVERHLRRARRNPPEGVVAPVQEGTVETKVASGDQPVDSGSASADPQTTGPSTLLPINSGSVSADLQATQPMNIGSTSAGSQTYQPNSGSTSSSATSGLATSGEQTSSTLPTPSLQQTIADSEVQNDSAASVDSVAVPKGTPTTEAAIPAVEQTIANSENQIDSAMPVTNAGEPLPARASTIDMGGQGRLAAMNEPTADFGATAQSTNSATTEHRTSSGATPQNTISGTIPPGANFGTTEKSTSAPPPPPPHQRQRIIGGPADVSIISPPTEPGANPSLTTQGVPLGLTEQSGSTTAWEAQTTIGDMTQQSPPTTMEAAVPAVPARERIFAPKSDVSPLTCRHEYVKIYQRRLKGLDRRLVSTRAYLPVGFKLGDFGHLSEGSFCFCTKCRKRLFPKRSQGEKDQARLERQQAKIAGVAAAFATTSLMGGEEDSIFGAEDEFQATEASFDDPGVDEDKMTVEVTVDELEVESVDVEDIKAEGVKLAAEDGFEESCELIEDSDS
ncbi:MAG: hypothetical protein SGJ27_04110 [Candidatus Melainabacteria bacterium]|nr:hypothetical protein [Candidatus Melainabacteria bacterium]